MVNIVETGLDALRDKAPIDQHTDLPYPNDRTDAAVLEADYLKGARVTNPITGDLLKEDVALAINEQNKRLNFEYYCGSQAQLYFGDVFIDECVYVGWNLSSAKIPIYGYSQRKYSTLAEGPIEVSGTFGLNFKENAYLYIIQAYIAEKNDTLPREAQARKRRIERLLEVNHSEREGVRNPGVGHQMQKTVNALATASDSVFQAIANEMEDVVWGVGGKNGRLADVLPHVGDRTRADEFPSFDIYATFGNTEDPLAPSTVIKIEDVELTSRRMQYTIDGSPIVEHWSFIGRDVA